MPYLLMWQRVHNYRKWKHVFDAQAEARQEAGMREKYHYFNPADLDEIVVFFQAESEEKARAFAESDEARKAMERAGITEKPEIYFLTV